MELEQFRLDGKTALVAGGAGGIGEAIARQFAAVGAEVVILDVNLEGAEAIAQSIRDSGGRAEAVAGDVSIERDVEAAVARAVGLKGRLDVMANMAGIAARQRIDTLEEAFLDRLYAVHLKGTALGTKYALRAMTETGGQGSIINCASAATDNPDEGLGVYAAMKAGICALSMVAAKEAGKLNIRCNVISPGLIITAMTRRYGNDERGVFDQVRFDAFVRNIKAHNALDRVGYPADVANLALFLASDASKYVTGQIYRVNGGLAMR